MSRRIKGHALKMEWSGERGYESSSTGFCKCGWFESASSQNEVRNEYGFHLTRIQRFIDEGQEEPDYTDPMAYSPWIPNGVSA